MVLDQIIGIGGNSPSGDKEQMFSRYTGEQQNLEYLSPPVPTNGMVNFNDFTIVTTRRWIGVILCMKCVRITLRFQTLQV